MPERRDWGERSGWARVDVAHDFLLLTWLILRARPCHVKVGADIAIRRRYGPPPLETCAARGGGAHPHPGPLLQAGRGETILYHGWEQEWAACQASMMTRGIYLRPLSLRKMSSMSRLS